jgi:ubiquinone/menaquinone biosynthesis C-methylase UbiE
METELLPWALEGVDLGADVLEIGPGYGVATGFLRTRVAHLTCIEIDSGLVHSLSRRMARTNVTVTHGDATRLPFRGKSFSAAVCFTMLHHVPTPALQDRLLTEVARVLLPSGAFAGTDSLTSPLFRIIHLGDALTPVDLRTLPSRLESAGFKETAIDQRGQVFRFRATRGA